MADTRDRILGSTNELFRARGYHGTSLKAVTEAAGAPVGSIYHFFPGGKDELAAAVIETSGDAYRQLYEVIAAAATDPAAAVTDFFAGGAAVLEETDFIDPCPIGTVAREVASTNDALRRATQQVFRSWIASAADHFEAAGLARSDAEELATTLVAAIEGGFMLARAARDTAPFLAIGASMRTLVEQRLAEVAIPS